MLRYQIPISKFETSISTFHRYQRSFSVYDIEYCHTDIDVDVFDIEQNVDIVDFDIDVNIDIGGGKVPDGQCNASSGGRTAGAAVARAGRATVPP